MYSSGYGSGAGSGGMILAIIIICIIINCIMAACMCNSTKKKGYDDVEAVALLVVFTGFIGCLYALSLPNQKLLQQNEEIIRLLKMQNSSGESPSEPLPPLE
ncbi:MAG: hypothetical protein LKI32_05655 [Lachnospiraceae bacterium]|jgi:hypothetical protein|nr:hypothetical protein [Lachnospiraceae bacterium]MCI1657025.1 hypothetical protein [Lachnospiraceae bacterium]MCI2195550.1 hypothetical protein [Lachnospiraceae bacterium]